MNYSGPEREKIRSMFDEIAGSYDKANDVMSLGIHHIWRQKLVNFSGAELGQDVLDCATGTGDLAIAFKKAVGQGRVVGTDFSSGMLEPAPNKAKKLGLEIEFSVADVMDLPFAENEFDIASISFGIRNVQDPVQAMSELARVVKPGGKVMILEFGQPKIPVFSQAFQFYSKNVLPKIGGWLSGKTSAYEYLENSSAKFPCREDFLAMASKAYPFAKMQYIPVSGGIAYIYKLSL
tara:strand:+ start:45281 stop:45985 length:705 start_codon:yes stop_codon:yes gene_type:complete